MAPLRNRAILRPAITGGSIGPAIPIILAPSIIGGFLEPGIGRALLGPGIGRALLGPCIGRALLGPCIGRALLGPRIGRALIGPGIGRALIGPGIGPALIGPITLAPSIVGGFIGPIIIGPATIIGTPSGGGLIPPNTLGRARRSPGIVLIPSLGLCPATLIRIGPIPIRAWAPSLLRRSLALIILAWRRLLRIHQAI